MNRILPAVFALVACLAVALAAGTAKKPIAVAERYGKAERISAVGPGKFKVVFTRISGLPKFLKVNDGTQTLTLGAGQRLETVVVPCANFEVYDSNPFGLGQVKVSEVRVSEWHECHPEFPTEK